MTEKTLDQKFSKKVTSLGYCQLEGKDNIKCGGRLDPMHIVTRGIHVLRWNIKNALCGCRNHHRFYTDHPKLWREFVSFFFPKQWAYVQKHKNDVWDKNLEAIKI